jgi:hypothetical protein
LLQHPFDYANCVSLILHALIDGRAILAHRRRCRESQQPAGRNDRRNQFHITHSDLSHT